MTVERDKTGWDNIREERLLIRSILFPSTFAFLLVAQPAVAAPSRLKPPVAQYDAARFNASVEFPNFFLPKKYRGVPVDQIPKAVIERYSALAEKALVSISNRVTINVVTDAGIENKRIFPYLQEMLSKKNLPIEVMPAGGLVRGENTYLYDRLKQAGADDPAKLLKSIIRESDDISIFNIKGFGSDFDVLYKNKHGLSKSQLDKANDLITYTLNGVEEKLGLSGFAGEEKRIFVTVGDVKSYEDQITRSVNQGGALTDNLAIDLAEGKVLNPDWARAEAGNVFQDMIAGRMKYLPLVDVKFREDPAKQTVRGIRSVAEQPWLALTPESEETLAGEIDDIIDHKVNFTPKAETQLKKIFNNTRYGGAHNRFYRVADGTIDEKARRMFRKVGFQAPYYSIGSPLEIRKSRGLAGFPNHLFKSPEEIKELSRRTLYHGTSFNNAGYSSRGGFLKSINSDEQLKFGSAIKGDGSYFSFERSTAAGYQKDTPFIFEARIRPDPKVRFLDLDDPKVLNDPGW